MTKLKLEPLSNYFKIVKGNANGLNKRKPSNYKESVPLITSSAFNDGISMITLPLKQLKLDKKKRPQKDRHGNFKYKQDRIFNNTLTINNNGSIGYVFYHPYPFIASSDVSILIIKHNQTTDKKFTMTRWVALYLKASIEKQQDRFKFGFKLTLNRLKKLNVILPVDKNGLLDINYMTTVIRKIYKIKNDNAPHYKLTKPKCSLKTLKDGKPRPWELFKIKDIFGDITSGRHYPQRLRIAGNLPFVSSSAKNNGVRGFYGNALSLNTHQNTISVTGVGLSGCAFYHERTFINDRDAHILLDPKFDINVYNALFICTCIYQQHFQFQYGYILKTDRLYNLRINLPATEASYKIYNKTHNHNDLRPDFNFMNQYIKSMITHD